MSAAARRRMELRDQLRRAKAQLARLTLTTATKAELAQLAADTDRGAA